MRILALDLGTKCGWAVGSPTDPGPIRNGVWNFQPTKFDSAGIRFSKFEEYLAFEIAIAGIDKVVYEAVRNHMAIDAAHVYGGFMAILQAVCIKQGIPYEGVPVQTIKKHATGKGNADKKAMVKAAIKKWKNINVTSDDQADALHLLDYVTTHKKEKG